MSCAFCDSKEVQSRLIIKDDIVIAFPSIQPIVPGHVLVCPVRCVASIDDLDEEEIAAILSVVSRIKHSLRVSFGVEGFNHAWNENEIAGQSVPHFHLHIVPRKKGDAAITDYEPRKFLYRPVSRANVPLEELKQVADIIKQNLV